MMPMLIFSVWTSFDKANWIDGNPTVFIVAQDTADVDVDADTDA